MRLSAAARGSGAAACAAPGTAASCHTCRSLWRGLDCVLGCQSLSAKPPRKGAPGRRAEAPQSCILFPQSSPDQLLGGRGSGLFFHAYFCRLEVRLLPGCDGSDNLAINRTVPWKR